ncbi:MAG: hypothetical protein HKN25_07495 [Pyrinomonadaceae bacterium]|nr:hypothetical protein [Pyrinomonadaceae bacterium]
MSFSELPKDPTVGEVFKFLITHPSKIVTERWNWKAATLSGIMRGSIYFFTHISLGLRAAISAMSVEFVFRALNSGVSASIAQSFRKAKPKWLATICVMGMLPAYGHIVEYTIHTISGDQNRNKSILISIAFSILSALFNLFMMRRGTLIVNDPQQKSFGSDLKSMPVLGIQFVALPFVWLYRKAKKGVSLII